MCGYMCKRKQKPAIVRVIEMAGLAADLQVNYGKLRVKKWESWFKKRYSDSYPKQNHPKKGMSQQVCIYIYIHWQKNTQTSYLEKQLFMTCMYILIW